MSEESAPVEALWPHEMNHQTKQEYPPIDSLDQPHFVWFGGGGGTSAVAAELVEGLPGDWTFVIAVSDSGGSVAKYRKYTGLALSDLTKTIYALAKNDRVKAIVGDDDRFNADATLETLTERNVALVSALTESLDSAEGEKQTEVAELETILGNGVVLGERVYVENGDHLDGISYGNFVLGALKAHYEKTETGDLGTAVKTMSEWLGVAESVHILPAVTVNHDLVMEHMVDGQLQTVETEAVIDETKIQDPGSVTVSLKCPDGRVPQANPAVITAIDTADHIIYGTGSPITSVIPSIVAGGVPEAIQRLRDDEGNAFLAVNLTAEKTTPGLIVEELEEIVGRHAVRATHVVYNNGEIEGLVPLRYRDVSRAEATVIAANLVGEIATFNQNDPLAREGHRRALNTNGKNLGVSMAPHTPKLKKRAERAKQPLAA